jgi:hypothetical protein
MRNNQARGDVVEFSSGVSLPTKQAAIERFWLVAVAAVLAGWGGASYYMFTSMGWFGRGLTVTMVAAAALAVVAFVRVGSRPVPAAESSAGGHSMKQAA